jgi:hypothetical protein
VQAERLLSVRHDQHHLFHRGLIGKVAATQNGVFASMPSISGAVKKGCVAKPRLPTPCLFASKPGRTAR